MTEIESVDFFTDQSLIADPYPYFDALRAKCPVLHTDAYGVVAVTGHEEAAAVYKDPDTFSSAISVGGPFPPLPFTPEGDDISDLLAQHRDSMPMSEHMITMDPPQHQYARSLLTRLITPRRLKENEQFVWRLADEQLDEFIDRGRSEFLEDYAKPFSLLVIADLLGVPEEDHDEFRLVLGGKPRPGARVGSLEKEALDHNPLQWLDDKFSTYLEERRAHPREDVLTGLATANYPDGSVPPIPEVVRSATFLFAAGQETTTKLLTAAVRVLAENPDIVEQLDADRSLIGDFVEEMLRMESPVKSDFRLVRKSTTLGGVDIAAGTTLMVCPGAVNRDPRRFDNPHQVRVDRDNVRDHIAFGRGPHTCPGGPLARVEGRVTIERLLDRLRNLRIDEDKHGPADARTYGYEPTYILRGMTDLHIVFDKAD
ncbi:cytochrome P450 [Nocardia callitridis]|uniref:Cytochrome P450 n=1 Tax=Nocardia callitridis TaxID=648753 RepID=A0ABP9KPV7_9NOCA